MEAVIENYYKEYQELLKNIKKQNAFKIKIENTLIKTDAGKLYFSLDALQKDLFRKIYTDDTFQTHFSILDILNELETRLDLISSKISSHESFPFKQTVPSLYITNGENTYNAITGESTESLDSLKKQLIKEIIKNKYGFPSNLTITDIPLIQVIYNRFKKESVGSSKKAIINDILKQVDKIHTLDQKEITYKENRYKFINELRETLLKEELEIVNSKISYQTKDLLLFDIDAAKYEILLLEGKKVTTILEDIESNNDKEEREYKIDALVKAYYNLTNINFRENSEYFTNDNDIWYAEFETANYRINKRLLKMMKR